jgi:hypothetical protein
LNKITLPSNIAIDANVLAQIRNNRDAIIKAIISRYSLNAEKQVAVHLLLQALMSQCDIELPNNLYAKSLCEEIRTLTNILIEHKINIENEFKTVIAKYKDSDNNIRMHHELSEEDKKGGTIGKDEEYLRVYKAALGSLALTDQISKTTVQVTFGDQVKNRILERSIENPKDPRKFVIV